MAPLLLKKDSTIDHPVSCSLVRFRLAFKEKARVKKIAKLRLRRETLHQIDLEKAGGACVHFSGDGDCAITCLKVPPCPSRPDLVCTDAIS